MAHCGWNRIQRHPVITVFAVALLARAIVAVGVTLWFGGSLFADDATYSSLAAQVAEGRTQNWGPGTVAFYNRYAAFLLPLTAAYTVFWPTPIFGQLVIAIFGAATAALVSRLALEALSAAWSLVPGLIVALLPSQVVFSSLTLKDAVVWCVVAATAVVLSRGGDQIWPRVLAWWGALIVLMLLMAHLRLHSLVVLAWAAGLSAWFGIGQQRLQRGATVLILAVALPWIIGIGPAGAGLVTSAAPNLYKTRLANAYGAATAIVPEYEEIATLQREILALEARLRDAQQDPQSKRPQDPQSTAPTPTKNDEAVLRQRLASLRDDLHAAEKEAYVARSSEAPEPPVTANLAYLPKGLSVMLIEPYLWQSSPNPRVQIARAENILWYPILLLALVGLPAALRFPRIFMFPLLAGGGTVLMYALAEGNFGTAYRHRGEFVWAIALFAAYGLRRAVEYLRSRTKAQGA